LLLLGRQSSTCHAFFVVPARFFSINKTIIQGKVVRDGDVLGTGKKVGRVTVVTERVVGKKDDGTCT